MSLAGVIGGLSAGPILAAVDFEGLAVALLALAIIMIGLNLRATGTETIRA